MKKKEKYNLKNRTGKFGSQSLGVGTGCLEIKTERFALNKNITSKQSPKNLISSIMVKYSVMETLFD